MKLNKFLLSAIAAASLTACSDSPEIVDNNKGHWNADGTGYVSLSISMPDNVGSKGSRAAGNADGSHNDKLNDGELNEYAVYDATLVIFTTDKNNAAEGDYKLTAAYKLPVDFKNTATNEQISSAATVEINKINAKYAKALVILNKPSTIELDENAKMIKLKNTSGTSGTYESLADCTFADFQKKATEVPVKLKSGKGFTMTNAPLTTAQSVSGTISTGSSTTTTLANIDVDNIKQTAEEAKTSPAARIYVERSVAKVTLKDNDTNNHQLGNNTQIHYSIEGFVLDNTNPTTYIVRKAGETDNNWYNLKSEYFTTDKAVEDQYRFIGTTPVSTTDHLYRTYWAEDPNYNILTTEATGLTLTNRTTLKATDGDFTQLTTSTGNNEHPIYCMENTFNVSSQTHRNTTRAILKVCFWRGSDTQKPASTPTLYMYKNDIETLLDDGTDKKFTNKVLADLNSIPAVSGYKGGVKSVTYSTTTNGVKKIETVTYNDVTTTEDASSNSPIFELIQKHIGEISVYEDGCAYYSVLIKHFGDQLTPWNTWEADPNKPAAGNNNIYPNNSEANYLGRYGVVRNNWYELGVSKVSKIGTPVINTPDNTPDDELDSYISVSINILSWAKRSQDVDLQ